MAEEDGFFSRWSRRKVLAKTGEPLPETAPAPAQPTPAVPRVAALAPVPAPAAAPPSEPPPPTLDDVARLTPESDFKPFVARAVDPQVRNAAMKTLFSDPHFNVMDGLDIYIDDYSKPDPLPLELARKLTSAQFMKVFDAPEAAPAPSMEAPAGTVSPASVTSAPGPLPAALPVQSGDAADPVSASAPAVGAAGLASPAEAGVRLAPHQLPSELPNEPTA